MNNLFWIDILNENQKFRLIKTVILSYFYYVLFNKYSITRRYLLGKNYITQNKQMQKEKIICPI